MPTIKLENKTNKKISVYDRTIFMYMLHWVIHRKMKTVLTL